MEWTRRMYIMGGGISPHRRTPAGVNFKGKSLDQEQSEFASLARICQPSHFPTRENYKTRFQGDGFSSPGAVFFCCFFVGETKWKINLNHESWLVLLTGTLWALELPEFWSFWKQNWIQGCLKGSTPCFVSVEMDSACREEFLVSCTDFFHGCNSESIWYQFWAFLDECLSGNWIASLKWIWDNSTPATALWGSVAEFVGHVARKWVPSQRFRCIWTVLEQIFGYSNNLRHGCWQLMGPQPLRVSQVYNVTSTFKRYETSLLLNMNFSFSCSRFRTWKLHVETIGNYSQAPWENRKSRCSDWKMSVQKWSRDPCHSAVTDKRVGLEVVELNRKKKLCEINIHLFKGPVDQGLPVVCHRTKQKTHENPDVSACFVA